jgi:hypothetical protein
MRGVSPFSLVEWVGYAQRTKIVQIQMSSSVARNLRLHVEGAMDAGGSQPCEDGAKLFPSLQCIVVTGRRRPAEYEIDILTSLQDLSEKHDLEVQY